MQPRLYHSVAFSLLEVVISLGIFTVLMVGILQALISTRNYVGEDEIRNDLELEALRLQKEMVGDLGNSAWFLNPPGPDFPNEPQPKLNSPQTYPNVGKGASPAFLGTTTWGDQIDFVKLRLKDGTYNSPYILRNHSVYQSRYNFNSANAVPMDEIFSAPMLTALVSNPMWIPGGWQQKSGDELLLSDTNPANRAFVWPVFESAAASLSYQENACLFRPNKSPRLYRYIVRARNGSNNGRLVRQYSNGPGSDYTVVDEHSPQIVNAGDIITPPDLKNTPNPWVDDVVLSDSIKATDDPAIPSLQGIPGVRFDTFLTDSSVRPNEIRIRLILVREPQADLTGARVIRHLQISVSMRSITY
jgi:type II secretory pathway pseudopilin PulG